MMMNCDEADVDAEDDANDDDEQDGSLVAEHDEKIERQCFYIALALEI